MSIGKDDWEIVFFVFRKRMFFEKSRGNFHYMACSFSYMPCSFGGF